MLEKWLNKFLRALLRLCFDVEVSGTEFLPPAGQAAIIASNHQSLLDPILLAAFLPEKPAFAMNTTQARQWYFKPFLWPFKIFRIDPRQPMSTKALIRGLRQGLKTVIFPEGRITATGSLMKIYDSAGMVADRARVPVIPVRIEGAQYSTCSRVEKKLKLRWFPQIRITILPPVILDLPASIRGRKRRKAAGERMHALMCEMMFATAFRPMTLLEAVWEANVTHGGAHIFASDAKKQKLTYRAFWRKAFVLARMFDDALEEEEHHVGLMLPTSMACLVSFFAVQLTGRIPALLNFTSGARNIDHACRMACVRTLITSREFITQAKLEHVINALTTQVRVIYLEDIRDDIKLRHKLWGIWKALRPERWLDQELAASWADDPAVVLYTSGSEGTPKGVVLSHRNILANIAQALSRFDLSTADTVFNAMPMFHSFGLTIGSLMPIVTGIRAFLHPSPLHYRVIPELCYETNATVLLGTDTFLSGYARYAHPYDFYSVRFAVAGAERLREETRQLYFERFGVKIFEGYGVTEMSPVISANTAMHNRHGSVGKLMPGIETRLEPVEGITDGGRLLVRGPNLMLGYLHATAPGVIDPQSEWYDTGDIVSIDAEGYLKIKGRAKRFAKLAGEMVSLQVVEDLALALWPEFGHAAIVMQQPGKGEEIWLISEYDAVDRTPLLHHARSMGIPDIAVPRKLLTTPQLPRLGTGKVDYVTLKSQLEQYGA